MGDSARWKSEALGKPDGREASVICLFMVANVSSRQPPVRERLHGCLQQDRGHVARQAGSPGQEAAWTVAPRLPANDYFVDSSAHTRRG